MNSLILSVRNKQSLLSKSFQISAQQQITKELVKVTKGQQVSKFQISVITSYDRILSINTNKSMIIIMYINYRYHESKT